MIIIKSPPLLPSRGWKTDEQHPDADADAEAVSFAEDQSQHEDPSGAGYEGARVRAYGT